MAVALARRQGLVCRCPRPQTHTRPPAPRHRKTVHRHRPGPRGHARTSRRDRSRPRRQLPAATRLLSCTENFLTQSLVNSRVSLVNSRPSLVHALLPLQPLHPPPKALQPGPYSPGADHARRPSPASRLPCCPQNFFAHNLTHSLVISRVTLLHLPYLSTPSTAPIVLLTSIPFATGTLPANATTESWPSRLPLRNPKCAIQRPTCSFPLARAWTTV